MSKSNFFGPGANDESNGTVSHTTSVGANPSPLATAAATAPSKPCPLAGSSSLNQGSYAGLSVPMVSLPGVISLRLSLAHASTAEADPLGAAAGGVAVSSGAQAVARMSTPAARRSEERCMRETSGVVRDQPPMMSEMSDLGKYTKPSRCHHIPVMRRRGSHDPVPR